MIESISDAINNLQEYLQTLPASDKPSNSEHVNFNLVGAIYSLRITALDLISALEECTELCTHSDESIRAMARDFYLDVSLGEIESAYTKILEFIDANPKMAEGYFLAGVLVTICARKCGWDTRLRGAIQQLTKAVSLRPDWASAWYWMGESISGFSEYDLVTKVKCYEAALGSPRHEIDSNVKLALLYQGVGEFETSHTYLSRYWNLREEVAARHPIGRAGIRILGEVNSYAFGHMGELLDLYLKGMQLGWISEKKTILIAPEGRISNTSLLSYWSQFVEVVSDHDEIADLYSTYKSLEYNTAFFRLPDGRCVNNRTAHCLVQEEWERQGREPLLKLTDEHRQTGRAILHELGLPENAWFAALHVRSPHYKREQGSEHNSHREASLESFIPAIEEITARGGWVVRICEESAAKLPDMQQVIDYGHTKHKSADMDVYILASARFLLGTSAGTLSIPSLFGVPSIATNFPPTLYRQPSSDIFIPKLLFDQSSNRTLSFAEMLSPPIVECERGGFFIEKGLGFIDNTSEEIAAATVEMLDKLNGGVIYSSEDEILQQRFQSLLNPIFGKFLTRISRQFLENHKELL